MKMMFRYWLLLVFLSTPVWGESLHWYVNDNGVKVFTNIGVIRKDIDLPKVEAPAPRGTSSRYDSLIHKSAAKYNLDSNLMKAIVAVESNFNPKAVSSKGCIGLMQLHPDTAKRFAVGNIYAPADNIEGGAKYLNFLMDFFGGNLPHVLAAYNAGENAVVRHGGIPPYRETQGYVRKVTSLYKTLGATSEVEPAPPRPRKRLYRLVFPDGSVLFTDARSRHLTPVAE